MKKRDFLNRVSPFCGYLLHRFPGYGSHSPKLGRGRLRQICAYSLIFVAANFTAGANKAESEMTGMERQCHDDFHFQGGRKWRKAVYGENDAGFDMVACSAFVSEDLLTWIGSDSTDLSHSINLAEKNQKKCLDLFNGKDVRVESMTFKNWEAVVAYSEGYGGVREEIQSLLVQCDPFLSEDNLTWIGSGENGSSEAVVVEKSKTQVAEQSSTPLAPAVSSGGSSTSIDTSQGELAFWNAIASSDDPDELRAYLEIYPNGTYAGLARLRIKKLGGTASASTSSIPNIRYGNYHALVIGNNKYDALPDLRTAVSDARAIANLLEVDYGFNVTKLENATRYETLIAIRDLRSEIGKEDNVLIYYAGHGYLDADSGEGYWLPSDADDTRVDWILTSGVVSNVKAMQAKHVMIVADSCFSGTLTRGLRIEQRTPDYFQKIVGLKARTAMTSGGLEPVMDGGGGRYSVFANAFISVLNSNKTVLDGQQLFTDLRRKVMNNSDQTPEYGNIHKAGHDGGDFLFVRQ